VILSLVGCSASSKEESSKLNNKNNPEMDSAASSEKQVSLSSGKQEKANIATENTSIEVPNQMVIYQADLQLRIKNFDQTVRNLEGKAEHYGGYVAESSVSKEGAEQVSGNLTIRIPQQHFQDFLHDAEGQALVVLQRNITGQDVTEEYVDLDSRIKSKRVVEERLLSFMKGATKTEDLLKISADLATVQEEIEIITGRMKFLVNQTALSTVNIGLYENKVIIPKIDQDKLNTWEKTKKQFMKSINMLLAALSGFIVFIVGNLPILSVLIVLAVLGYFFYKKRKNRKDRD
jgi:hypothetical protein